MTVAILSNDKPSFQKPMADGLARVLNDNNVLTKVLYEGLDSLEYPYLPFISRMLNSGKILLKKLFRSKRLLYVNRSIGIERLIKKLKGFDAIIIIAHFPSTMARKHMPGLEVLREKVKKPLINYDLVFVNNADGWFKKILEEERFGGFTGLERFDYYLVASDISEIPVNSKIKFPYLKIGLDLQSQYLITCKKDFRVLLDFPRKGFEGFRKLQKEVLNELLIPYTELSGIYSHDEIRRMYSNCSAFFLSFRETFGLPIIELQLCGAKVFLPFKHWAPSHYLKNSDEPGIGNLGSNFIVYENDKDKLKLELISLKDGFDSEKNLLTFKTEYPYFHRFNLDNIKKFIFLLRSGRISSISHTEYKILNNELIRELPQNMPDEFRSSC